MNRSVLIVTPFFAPQSHAAVFRAYKLAKYLPQYGWKPYVVTTDTNYLYNEDAALLSALPCEVEVHRARYIEPSIRGVRMALGGRDRTFKAMKAAGAGPVTADPIGAGCAAPAASPSRDLYAYLRKHWLDSPDAYWTWERPAVVRAIQLVRDHNIGIVYTSADPYTSHRIGYQIQQRTGTRWVADFRDPHTHRFNSHSQVNRVFAKQRAAEKLAVNSANVSTVAAESIALVLHETYGLKDTHPIRFIPTGLDESLVAPITTIPIDEPFLVFTGEFLPTYSDAFFRLFSRALSQAPSGSMCKALFIGRMDVNAPRIRPFIARYGLEGRVELMDHVPQSTLYAYLKAAKAALLIPGSRATWWCLYAKLVDYLALRKPVIAMVPDPSEARMHLQRSGLGLFLEEDEVAAAERLSQFLFGSAPPLVPNTAYCNQFFAHAQVKAFADLFDGLLASA